MKFCMARYPDIPWKQISGFRNILVHSYLGNIDALTVQRVVEQYLPPLASAIAAMLALAPEWRLENLGEQRCRIDNRWTTTPAISLIGGLENS